MKLYLSSYKLGNQTDKLKEWLKYNDNKIAIIPNSRDLKENKEEERTKMLEYTRLLEEIGFDVDIVDLKKYFNNKEEMICELKKYSAFCVIGGNVFVLRMAMKLSGFDTYLLENKKSNLLYIGWSAGSCVLSKNLKGLDIVDKPLNPYSNEAVIYEGVGLINKLFIPHFQSNHKESQLIDEVIKYLNENNLEYDAFHDGEVMILDL